MPTVFFELMPSECAVENLVPAARCVQYDLTWFINPVPAPYYDVLALEHGYTRGTVNATSLHITVRHLFPHTSNVVTSSS